MTDKREIAGNSSWSLFKLIFLFALFIERECFAICVCDLLSDLVCSDLHDCLHSTEITDMPGTKGLTFVSWNKIALGKPLFC